jgi:hypothetical protein
MTCDGPLSKASPGRSVPRRAHPLHDTPDPPACAQTGAVDVDLLVDLDPDPRAVAHRRLG